MKNNLKIYRTTENLTYTPTSLVKDVQLLKVLSTLLSVLSTVRDGLEILWWGIFTSGFNRMRFFKNSTKKNLLQNHFYLHFFTILQWYHTLSDFCVLNCFPECAIERSTTSGHLRGLLHDKSESDIQILSIRSWNILLDEESHRIEQRIQRRGYHKNGVHFDRQSAWWINTSEY